MVKYVQISAKYSDFFRAMKMPALSQKQENETVFQSDLEKDKDRCPIVEFRPHQYSTTQNKLFDPNGYESRHSYTQGDNYAGIIITPFRIFLLDDASSYYHPSSPGKALSLAYIDDSNIPCGLTIYEMGLRPNSHYVIGMTRKTTAAPEARDLWIYCDEETLGYTPLRDSTEITSQEMKGSQRLEALIRQLNSDNIGKLITPLFKEDTIDANEFDRLSSRLVVNYNIDFREKREPIFQEYLKLLQNVDSARAEVLQQLSQENINFYEETYFETVLKDGFDRLDSESKQKVFKLYLQFKGSLLINEDQETFLNGEAEEEITLHDDDSVEDLYNEVLKKYYEPDLSQHLAKFKEQIDACNVTSLKQEALSVYEKIKHMPLSTLALSGKQVLMYLDCWQKAVEHQDVSQLSELKYYNDLQQRIPLDLEQLTLTVQCEQSRKLAVTALEELEERQQPLPFDPQGRILVKTKHGMVSFDVSKNEKLQGAYNDRLKTELSNISQTDNDKIINLLNELPSKSCIIPLQHELYFHLSLTSRVYSRFKGISDHNVQEAYQRAMPEVNALIMKAFAEGLTEATKTGKLDIKVLNKHLDEARDRITEEGHTLLLHHLRTITHADILMPSSRLSEEALKHAAETTTASDDSLLYLDNHLGLATLIEGSTVTSHDRQAGTTHLAHRSLRVFRLNEPGEIVDKIPRTQVRTSSLPVKVGLREQEYIDDVKTKLMHLADTYQFRGAFTYNLFTALHDTGDELSDLSKNPQDQNRQTQSTRHILLGAHAYNREMSQRHPKGAYCFVQGVSVSGFGEALGYRRVGLRTALTNENTLMSELSLVRVIDKAADNRLQEQYQRFLQPQPISWIGRMMGYRDPYYPTYFFPTQAGKEARRIILENKEAWKRSFHKGHGDSSKQLVMGGLKKIMAFDLHFSHQYAKTLEALSLYLEDQSIFGCKSGNERTPIVYQRSELLDQQTLPISIMNALTALNRAIDREEAVKAAKALRLAINQEYNATNVYGAATMIPLLDQGAGHKIKIKKGHDIDRNRAEDAEITHLQQKHVAKMQAHKGLVGYMLAALSKPFQPKVGQDVASGVDGGVETSEAKQGRDSTRVINSRLSRSSGTKPRYSLPPSIPTIPESDEEDDEEPCSEATEKRDDTPPSHITLS